jgi:hypothetical protein
MKTIRYHILFSCQFASRVPDKSFPFPFLRHSPIPSPPSRVPVPSVQSRPVSLIQVNACRKGVKSFLLQPPPAPSVLLLPPWAFVKRNVPCAVSVSSLVSHVSCLIPHVSCHHTQPSGQLCQP